MEGLIRSSQRVADHGEVFTPPDIVNEMINLVRDEVIRIESRFLEPACGSGNFLTPVLEHKFSNVDSRYGSSDFEKCNHALLALMSVYGIELLEDNVRECRQNLLDTYSGFVGRDAGPEFVDAAEAVLAVNIIHGDALTMQTSAGVPITFSEWSYLGKGTYHRRDFRFDTLTQMSSFGEDDTLFADLGKQEIFTPSRDHGSLSVMDIAGGDW